MDRKKILIWAQVVFVLGSLGLGALSYWRGPIPVIYGVLLIHGVAQAYNNPARSALLPRLVPQHAFGNAVTWSSSAFQTSAVVGPAIGGIVIAISGQAMGAYVLDAVLTTITWECCSPSGPMPRCARLMVLHPRKPMLERRWLRSTGPNE